MDLTSSLIATPAVDFDNQQVADFVAQTTSPQMDDKQRAIALYYGVRDSIRYDPYRVDLRVEHMRASTTLANGYGWCVPKAVLLAACCRSSGIPARLGFGDVRNHISTPRLQEMMQCDIFYWHGYTEILLDGIWRKATPAFNLDLCEKFGILPLEFDGTSDSIFHPFDAKGQRHLEYLHDRGSFDDLPLTEITATFKERYPHLLSKNSGDFYDEASTRQAS